MCGGQQAYPVYVSIGNISKSIRRKINKRATVLLGYLPVDNFENVANEDERARLKNDLTHRAMEMLMEPLKEAMKEGVEFTCADGRTRRGYPIPAAFEGDWPEQCAMASCDQSGCPVCKKKFKDRGDYGNPTALRTRAETLDALRQYFRTKDLGELDGSGLKPWWPWWASLPYVNLSTCLVPDILHQLYQGLVKPHAVRWSQHAVGLERLDDYLASMPKAPGMRHFSRGVSKFKNWTGRESKEVAKQLLPAVADQTVPKMVTLVRAILDFTFRAHQSRMTDTEVDKLEEALAAIHESKGVLVELGVHKSFGHVNRIPKLHMVSHYSYFIREMGTPDDYSTEAPEHLHIEYAKRGWRHSNKVRPLPQMIKFVQRFEAIRIQRAYLDTYYGLPGDRTVEESRVVYGDDEDALEEKEKDEGGEAEDAEDEGDEEDNVFVEGRGACDRHEVYPEPDRGQAKKPTAPGQCGWHLIEQHGVTNLVADCHRWLKKHLGPSTYHDPVTPFHLFNVWHKFYLTHGYLYFDPDQSFKREVVRAKPPAPALPGGQPNTGTFDTVLFMDNPKAFGIHRESLTCYQPTFFLSTC